MQIVSCKTYNDMRRNMMKRSFFVCSLVMIVVINASNDRVIAQTAVYNISAQEKENPSSPETNGYKYAERDWDTMTSVLHTGRQPTDIEMKSFVMSMLKNEPDVVAQGASLCSA